MPWWAWVAILIVVVIIVSTVLDRKGIQVDNPNAADPLTGIGKMALKDIPAPKREMIQRLSLAEAITMNAIKLAASNEQDEASWERLSQEIYEVLNMQGRAEANLKRHSREYEEGRLTKNRIRQQASFVMIQLRRDPSTPLPPDIFQPLFPEQARATRGPKYFPRAQRRMEAVAQEMDRFIDLANKPNQNDRKLAKSAARLRALAQEQKSDITPSLVLDEHKDNYFRLMDIQARKAEDVLATGGANYDLLLAEEEALMRENQTREQEVDQRMRRRGLTYPD